MNSNQKNKNCDRAEVVKETIEHLSEKQSDMLISSLSYSIRQIPQVAKTFAIAFGIVAALVASILVMIYVKNLP